MAAAVLYAFTLGLVAAVNPCGFPLLPAYLVSFTFDPARDRASRAGAAVRALTAGACVTAGFVVTFGLAGILVTAGAALIIGWVPWVMVAVGAGLAVLGVAQLTGRWHGLAMPQVRFRSGRGALAMGGFGVAYGVGSLSCSLPLFLAGVATVFTSGGWAAGAAAFLAYAIGMGLFVTAAGLVVAVAGESAVRSLRGFSRWVPRIGGALVAAVGAYLVYYWVSELAAPTVTPALTRWVDGIQASVTAGLSAAPAVSASVLAMLVVAGIVATGWMMWRRQAPGRTEKATSDD